MQLNVWKVLNLTDNHEPKSPWDPTVHQQAGNVESLAIPGVGRAVKQQER